MKCLCLFVTSLEEDNADSSQRIAAVLTHCVFYWDQRLVIELD